MRNTQQAFLLQRLQVIAIKFIDLATALADYIQHLELGIQEGTTDLTEHVRGSDIDPSILVDLATEKLLPVCSLVTDNLCPFDHVGRVDAESSPLTADVVFRFMKAVRAQVTDGS